jgi:hypothetical protein
MEREALQMCLEYIETNAHERKHVRHAIQAALAQPAQREWVGLTDDALADIWYKGSLDWMEFARAHEAALKEKNT